MRVAYADPPYFGQAKSRYGGREVNHRLLIAYLEEFDGWALSCSSPSLRELLPMCPDRTRVMAWVKPFCIFKPNVNPAYAWEPVLVRPVRTRAGKDIITSRDWVSEVASQKGFRGAKPPKFCHWLFDILGLEADDSFEDLFPGSGAVTKAWIGWQEQYLNEPRNLALGGLC